MITLKQKQIMRLHNDHSEAKFDRNVQTLSS